MIKEKGMGHMGRRGFLGTWILLLCILLLAGCGEESAVETTVPRESAVPMATETVPETTVPAATEEPVTIPMETEGEKELPYLLRIRRPDQSIYEGPGYDYIFVGTVREQGSYTIVEETWDQEGNLWGKLKSGAGWVDLTQIRSEEAVKPLISANYAEADLLIRGAYHLCPGDALSYPTSVAFRAYGTLRDVALFPFELREYDFVPGEDFYQLPELTEEMPLVAELAFPGDMSTYGIRFVDEQGNSHVYCVFISGRNGALVLKPYES